MDIEKGSNRSKMSLIFPYLALIGGDASFDSPPPCPPIPLAVVTALLYL